MKKMMVSMMLGVMIATAPVSAEAKQLNSTKVAESQIQHKYHNTQFMELTKQSDKKVWKKLLHRKGKKQYMVTKETGTVLNAKSGAGKDSCGHYISYSGVKGIKKGSKVRTYLIYCRSCNEPDDIIARYDVVIKR